MFHNNKISLHDRAADIASKASSFRMFRGTNEFAEDLTGQRMPLNTASWVSETKVKLSCNSQCGKFTSTSPFQANYDGKVYRPNSAPIHRVLSQMTNQEPVFRTTTNSQRMDDIKLSQINPHQVR
jgi:hypothetical protein